MKHNRSMIWAEFRLAIVGQLLYSQLERGELSRRLDELSETTWFDPESYKPLNISRSTIERWYYQARQSMPDPLALWVQPRSDKDSFPSISQNLKKTIDRHCEKHPDWRVSELINASKVEFHGERDGHLPSSSSIRRYVDSRLAKLKEEKGVDSLESYRFRNLVSHLRRVIITKCVVVRLLEFGCTRRWSCPGKQMWSRIPVDEKLYILEAFSKYKRAGGSLADFCAATSLSTASVERWLSANRVAGRSGIEPKKHRHKAIIEGWNRTKQLLEIFHSSPSSHGINRTSWTGEALVQAYKTRWGDTIAAGTARRHIAQCGYTYRRAKNVLTSSDPQYHKKLHSILETLHSLKEDETFFFVDELGPVRVRRHGGRSYMKRDSIAMVPKIQPNKGSVCLVGALCARTNQVSWLYCTSKDSRAMIDITEMLFNQYHGMRTLYLTWDAASWHSSEEFVTWLNAFNGVSLEQGDGPIINVLPLPSNAQFLDVIESVFSGMKKAVIHNSNYQSPDEMKKAISRHFCERNAFFSENPKRAGKKIWEIDFFQDVDNIMAGNYREW